MSVLAVIRHWRFFCGGPAAWLACDTFIFYAASTEYVLKWPWWPTLLCGTIVVLVKWRIQRTQLFWLPFPWDDFRESFSVETAPLYRLLGFGLLLLVPFILNHSAKKITKNWFQKRWWDISDKERDGRLSWSDALILASLDDVENPTRKEDEPILRRELGKPFNIYLCSLFCVSVTFAVAVDYLVFPYVPNLILRSNETEPLNALVNASGNLAAYLALAAALVIIVFTDNQLRAKVRADARKEWIQQVRGLMTDIIEAIGENFSGGALTAASSTKTGSD